MNKYFKLAGWCVAVAVVGGLSGSHGVDLVNQYAHRVSIVDANNSANIGGVYWSHGFKNADKNAAIRTVVDATNTTFNNIPANITDAEFIKHFGSRPEWQGHHFFGHAYTPVEVVKFGESQKTHPEVEACDSWQNVLTAKRDNKISTWEVYKDVKALREDYLRQCAWNEAKDMRYTDNEATSNFNEGEIMRKGWFALLALFGTIPAIWIGFWRVVGAAVRSAKSEIKGDKK
ncbi:hypothetical protein MUU47_21750 [Scandinavium sp. H11S7]|uniref:Uncharacterized protein n=1 Tax=Scandinavium hiltneri TaxID=2926519 RepID=A0ABT2E721_9ENTR|nr:hypothetical protein [Scandinavium hiltneri]MCS2163700.1 hypothetical protein [Scandinavium hiltneri]